MRLSACSCRAEHYRRTERIWWMKAIWTRRLYHCYSCDEVMFIAPGEVNGRLEEDQQAQRRKARRDMALKGS
jgi:hypothetical protein